MNTSVHILAYIALQLFFCNSHFLLTLSLHLCMKLPCLAALWFLVSGSPFCLIHQKTLREPSPNVSAPLTKTKCVTSTWCIGLKGKHWVESNASPWDRLSITGQEATSGTYRTRTPPPWPWAPPPRSRVLPPTRYRSSRPPASFHQFVRLIPIFMQVRSY